MTSSRPAAPAVYTNLVANPIASPPARLERRKPDHSGIPRPLAAELRPIPAPAFYLTARQPLSPGAILLAIVFAVGALASVLYALTHSGHHVAGADGTAGAASAAAASGAPKDDDDPNQVDTIVLGDPTEAPVPAAPGDRVSPVHPTILIHLPRSGDQLGYIPNTPAGHLLYDWLAAFNHASYSGLADALPVAFASETAAQVELRQLTGGFSLLSAKEVQPGVLVFRLHDQTRLGTEVLGTLQVRANSNPAAIASFSLRAVPPPRAGAGAVPASTPTP